ncbi:MAG: S49 family peptidase, partial [Proteobacteria bacterium]|nr:S49 family peptidase [Pseudomonadota bacterium]
MIIMTATKNFFIALWRLIKLYFIFVGMIVTFSVVLIIMAFSSLDFDFLNYSQRDEPVKKHQPIGDFLVEVDLRGFVYDHYDLKTFDELLYLWRDLANNSLTSLRSLEKQIEELAARTRVKGVLFHIHSNLVINTNFAADLIKPMAKLAAKKPLYFYGDHYQGAVNYLIGSGDRIALAPQGDVMLPSATMVTYLLGNLMKRVGVGMDVIKAGDYKSADFFLTQIGQPERLHMTSVQESLEQVIFDLMVASRKSQQIADRDIKKWLNQQSFNDKSALKTKLVTDISHYQNFKDSLAKSQGLKWYDYETIIWPKSSKDQEAAQDSEKALVSLERALPKEITSLFNKGDGVEEDEDAVGYLSYSGTISLDHQKSSDEDITEVQVAKDVEFMLAKDRVKAVVVRINSPGGGVLASELIWHHLKRLADVKPMVVYIDNMAASGGYYMASAAHKIIARPSAITGSIGVLFLRPHLAQMAKRYG